MWESNHHRDLRVSPPTMQPTLPRYILYKGLMKGLLTTMFFFQIRDHINAFFNALFLPFGGFCFNFQTFLWDVEPYEFSLWKSPSLGSKQMHWKKQCQKVAWELFCFQTCSTTKGNTLFSIEIVTLLSQGTCIFYLQNAGRSPHFANLVLFISKWYRSWVLGGHDFKLILIVLAVLWTCKSSHF